MWGRLQELEMSKGSPIQFKVHFLPQSRPRVRAVSITCSPFLLWTQSFLSLCSSESSADIPCHLFPGRSAPPGWWFWALLSLVWSSLSLVLKDTVTWLQSLSLKAPPKIQPTWRPSELPPAALIHSPPDVHESPLSGCLYLLVFLLLIHWAAERMLLKWVKCRSNDSLQKLGHINKTGYCCLVTQSYMTLATSWTVARQALLSMGFSRQEFCSCHFLLQEILLTQGLNLRLLHGQVDSLPLSHQGSPRHQLIKIMLWRLDNVWENAGMV